MTMPYTEDDLSYKPIDQLQTGNVEYQDQPPVVTADKLMQRFYATREKAPEFDQAKADRLKRMGRINQIGQGVNVLGDILATSLGANVKRRQPDQTAPALYNSYQNMLDRYEGQKDAYDYRQFQQNRDNLRMQIGQANHADQLELARQRQKDLAAAKRMDNTLSWNKWKAEYDRNLDRDKNDREYKNRIASVAESKNSEKPAKPAKPEKPWVSVGTGSLNEREARNMYEEAVKYYGGSDSDYITGVMAQYQQTPVEGKKEIIGHYLNDSKAQNDRQRKALGKETTTAAEDIAKAKPKAKAVPSFFQ